MKKIIVLLLAFLTFYSCGKVTEKGTLTDQKVLNYIEVYKKLKANAPAILEHLNKNGDSELAGKEGFAGFEEIVQSEGLANYPEFVILNAKIGGVFGMIQATKGMETSSNLHDSGQQMFEDSKKIIQEQLDDPNVPEESKVELRKTLAEIDENSKILSNEYEKNSAWANYVLKYAEKITGLIVNEKDIEIVKKYEDEIFEAYTGFTPPPGLDGNMKPINFEDFN